MNKIVILQHSPSTSVQGQLANQLWNFISLYAYSREKGVPCYNYSFFEYQRFYRMAVGNRIIEWLYFKPFNFLIHYFTERQLIPVWRKWYKLFVFFMKLTHRKSIVSAGNSAEKDGPFYLPPTENARPGLDAKSTAAETLYTEGWLFRNPAGIVKYHTEIREHFRPIAPIEKTVTEYLAPLRTKYNHLVGLHVRQGDYKTFKGGLYYVPPRRAREVLDEYMREFNMDPKTTLAIIATNGPVDPSDFAGLNILESRHSAAEDLYLLSLCDVVIGSDSSFGNFAAYYGNIPHVVLQNGPMNWDYYRNKRAYFENNYCTLVHF